MEISTIYETKNRQITIIIGYLKIIFLWVDWQTRQKIGKETEELKNIIKQLGQISKYKTLRSYIYFFGYSFEYMEKGLKQDISWTIKSLSKFKKVEQYISCSLMQPKLNCR